MSGFLAASEVEKAGFADLVPYVEQCHPGVQLVSTSGQLYVQKWLGDFFWKCKQKGVKTVEVKVEKKLSQNFFFERDSNFGFTPGWLWTCGADWLWYYFCDPDNGRELYHADMAKLREWAFGDGPDSANILAYREVPQRAYVQKNHTRGFLVPIAVLQDAIDLRGPIDPVAAVEQGTTDSDEIAF